MGKGELVERVENKLLLDTINGLREDIRDVNRNINDLREDFSRIRDANSGLSMLE